MLRCDFGNNVKINLSNLRPLLPELDGSFLLECCLSDIRYTKLIRRALCGLTFPLGVCDRLLSIFCSSIRPAGGCSSWTATACDFISYYLTGAMAIMTIKVTKSTIFNLLYKFYNILFSPVYLYVCDWWIFCLQEPSSVRPVPISLFCSNRAGRHVSISDFLITEGLALRERSVKYNSRFIVF